MLRKVVWVSGMVSPSDSVGDEEVRALCEKALRSRGRTPQQIKLGRLLTNPKAADDELNQLQEELHPKHEVVVPRLQMSAVTVKFSLADITDTGPFMQLGQR